MASSNRGIQIGSAWFQRKINLRPQHRGVHLVTEEILRQIPELSQFSVGLCHVQSKYFVATAAAEGIPQSASAEPLFIINFVSEWTERKTKTTIALTKTQCDNETLPYILYSI